MSGRFLDTLRGGRGGPLVLDGAMGTQLYERGLPFTLNYEELNLSHPDPIREIFADYLFAGARVLETNTFGGNPTRLARHGLEGRLRDVNIAGVARAREALRSTGIDGFIAGSIGPTGLPPIEWTDGDRNALRDGFRAQADALAEGGADLLMIETMRNPSELLVAVEAGKKTGLPLVALASFEDHEGIPRMADGSLPEQIAQRLIDLGADVIGANCSEGPLLLEIAERMLTAHPNTPLCIAPNAGLPHRSSDGTLYATTPEDFERYARRLFELGVRMVGGCCGTTPAHIRAVAVAARS